MTYSAKILLDSISETGKRITTMEITFPRIVLAEFNTHRMFSRNSASSRAIPFEKQLDRLYENPFIPEKFPLNCKGMQPQEYVTKSDLGYSDLVSKWLMARDSATYNARIMRHNNIHKQILNRLLEPFQWHTVIVTSTEWDNFFKLRCDENAQYEIRRIADLMYDAYHAFDGEIGKPVNVWTNSRITRERGLLGEINGAQWLATESQKLKVGEWHCPLVSEEDEELIIEFMQLHTFGSQEFYIKKLTEIRKKISVARCARVSYLTHDGKRDIAKDLELFERLRISGHWSPFEHVATPFFQELDYEQSMWSLDDPQIRYIESTKDVFYNERSGNFIGWKQYRKEFPDENCTNFRKEN